MRPKHLAAGHRWAKDDSGVRRRGCAASARHLSTRVPQQPPAHQAVAGAHGVGKRPQWAQLKGAKRAAGTNSGPSRV